MCGSGDQQVGAAAHRCPASIRIINNRGQRTRVLEVSNMPVDLNFLVPFGQASPDPDTFRVHIEDRGETGASIPTSRLELTALKPDGTAFSPARTLQAEAFPAGRFRYRTSHLRLVVDEFDKSQHRSRTLLTDVDASDQAVEILGQRVRVTYTSACGHTLTAEATVGRNCRRVNLAVHILRTQAGGSGVVTEADVRRRISKWFRRVYAQLNLAPQLQQVRTVDPVSNVLCISNPHGRSAAGGGRIIFGVTSNRSSGQVTHRINHPTTNGDTPEATARALAQAINSSPYGFQVRVMTNPVGRDASFTHGPADVVVTDPSGGSVVVGQPACSDRQLTAVRNSSRINRFPIIAADAELFLGTPEQRALCYNYDTGTDRVDVYVVGEISAAVLGAGAQGSVGGQALIRGSFDPARHRRGLDTVSMSAFVARWSMGSGDSYPYTLAHEVGHVLLDAGHVSDQFPRQRNEVMRPWASADHQLGASKRFAGAAVPFDLPSANIDQNARMRRLSGNALCSF